MFNRLRRFIFDTSSFGDYIQILKESKDQKVIRLLNDHSYYNKNHFYKKQQEEPKGFLNQLLFGNMKVLNPISHFMLYWYGLVFLAIMYNYVEFGIVLAYEGAWEGELTTPLTLFFSCFTIFVLFVDIIVQMNTGYLKRGMIILQRKRVIRNYLRGTFLIDIAYVILLILCLATGSFYLNNSKYLCLTKVIRLFQIDDYFLRRFNVKKIKKTIYTILKLLVLILVISHAIAVPFYVLDHYIYVNGIFEPQFCWIYSSTTFSPIVSLPWTWQYFYSLYWGINTITNISYGDIQGANPTETAVMLFCMCFGFMVYGYVVNQIIKIIVWARASTDKRRLEILVMEKYMDNLQISQKVKNQVTNHLERLHRQEKNRNLELETQMRDKLPQDLRFKLVSNAYSVLNEKIVNIFQSTAATRFLFDLVQKKYTTDEQVSNQGDRALSLNYLHKGKMEYSVHCGSQQFVIYESEVENEFLGHFELFARKRWPYSIVSKVGSTVYSISRQQMFLQINSIETLKQKFKQVQYEVIFKQNLKRIGHTCFFCKVSHDWSRCPSRFPIVRSSLHTVQNRRQDGVRIIRRKYHTLDDRKKLQVLNPIRNMANKKLSNIIEKRIEKIRMRLNQKSQVLEIDIAYDWKYYDVSENLSRKKEYWNQLVGKKLNLILQKKQSQLAQKGEIQTPIKAIHRQE